MPVSFLFAAAENPNPMASEPWVAGTALVVFVCAFGFLYLKVWPVITKGLDDRNDKILGEIKAAEDEYYEAYVAHREMDIRDPVEERDAATARLNAAEQRYRDLTEPKAPDAGLGAAAPEAAASVAGPRPFPGRQGLADVSPASRCPCRGTPTSSGRPVTPTK